MAEVIYTPANDINTAPAEAPVEPVATTTPEVVDLSKIAHHDDGPPLSLEEATRLVTKRRREREGDEREIVERYVAGDDGPIKLRDAQRGTSDAHKTELGKAYLQSLGYNATDADGFAVADVAAQLGRKPSELRHDKVTVVTDKGLPVQELRDDQPIRRG